MIDNENGVVQHMNNTGSRMEIFDSNGQGDGEDIGVDIFCTLRDGRRWCVVTNTARGEVYVGAYGTPETPVALGSLNLGQLAELEAAITRARKALQATARPS